MSDQRYVSKELTHFVGRELQSAEQQYELLVHDILLKGKLGRPDITGSIESFTMSTIAGETLCGNNIYEQKMVCFCDIPVADFSVHMRKYSAFGIAFQKQFLLAKGASPVFYVSSTSVNRFGCYFLRGQSHRHSAVLNALMTTYRSLVEQSFLMDNNGNEMEDCPASVKALLKSMRILKGELDMHFFSYVKCFDATTNETHGDNFYMEREWRVLGGIPFSIEDVSRVILPFSFAKRFRQDVSDYSGQITFAD